MELLYDEDSKQVNKYIWEFQVEISAKENYSTVMGDRLIRKGPLEEFF